MTLSEDARSRKYAGEARSLWTRGNTLLFFPFFACLLLIRDTFSFYNRERPCDECVDLGNFPVRAILPRGNPA